MVDGRIVDRVEVEITDGRFRSVAVDVDPSPGADRRNGVTLPGLANAHSHAFHRVLRGRTQADRGSFWAWRDIMYSVAERLDPDSYRRLARAVFAEMACAGITAVGEFHYVHHQPDGTPYNEANAMGLALVEAAAEAGIRITLLDTIYQHGGLDAGGHRPVEGAQIRYRDTTVDGWRHRIDALSGAIRSYDHAIVGAAVHSVRAVDEHGILAAGRWASDNDAVLHAHVSEQPAENAACQAHYGVTPTEHLGQQLLGPWFTAVHGTHLSPADVKAYGSTRTNVCFCPTTERDLGDGIGPSTALVEAGASLCLGSDSHAVIDVLEEARLVELHERLRSLTRGSHRSGDLLAMATTVGHRSLAWFDAGTIAVGQRADLVTVDVDSIRTAGTVDRSGPDTLAGLLFAASAADVTDVVIDGRRVVADRRHMTVDVVTELVAALQELTDDR